MPKVIVDKKLAETLKSMRLDRKIPAKELAEKWKKSASYVSKLENGSVKSIEFDDLIKILEIIVGTNDSEKYLTELAKTVTYKFSTDEINNLLWMDNFDTVYRRIPVSEGLVNDILNKMNKYEISLSHLVDQINTNEFMPQHLRENPNTPSNIWFSVSDGTYIKMQLAYSDVEKILTQEKKKCNYIQLLAITLYLYRLTDYSHIATYSMSQDDYRILKGRAVAYLESFRIYTLTQKANLVEQANSNQEINDKLSSYDRENLHILHDAHEALVFYSDYDVSTANQLIKQFTDNMNWDSPFIMQIAGLPFAKLGQCSYRIKKDILLQIKKILDETLEIPDSQRRLEQY